MRRRDTMQDLIQTKAKYKLDQEYVRIDNLAKKLGVTTESALEYLLHIARYQADFKPRK
jgi:Mn-dependent DtxR family transcriptional regulator